MADIVCYALFLESVDHFYQGSRAMWEGIFLALWRNSRKRKDLIFNY